MASNRNHRNPAQGLPLRTPNARWRWRSLPPRSNAFLILVLLAMVVGACGGTSESTTTASDVTSSTDSDTPTDTSTTAPAAEKPFDGTTIDVLLFNFAFQEATEALLGDFEEQTGITVIYDVLGENEAAQKAAVELAAGTGAYDVVFAEQGSIPLYAQSGWIQPLDQFMTDPNHNDGGEWSTAGFLEGPLGAGASDGQQYGLPIHVGTVLMYYQKDIVESPPDTWEDLMALAQEVHNDPIPAFVTRGARGVNFNVWIYPSIFLGFGASWFADFPNDMHPTMDSPEAIAATEYWVELLNNYGVDGIASAKPDDVILNVQQGNAAIAIEGGPQGTRFFDPEVSTVADNLGVAMVPAGPAGRFPPLGSNHLTIPTEAPNPEAAWEFLKWVTSEEIMLRASTEGPHLAVTQSSVWEDPAFAEKNNYADGAFISAYQESADIGSPDYRPRIPEWPEMGDVLAAELSAAVSGQKTAEEAMRDVQAQFNAILIRAGYYDE